MFRKACRVMAVMVLISSCIVAAGQDDRPSFYSIERQRKILVRPEFLWGGAFLFFTQSLYYYFDELFTSCRVAGEATTKFVQETLRDAGYTDEQIRSVRVLKGKSFASLRKSIMVPCNDEQLQRARQYYETNDDADGRVRVRDKISKLRAQKPFRLFTDDELYILLHLFGEAVTADSIPLWRGLILHEMGHIMHSHHFATYAFNATIGSALAAYVPAALGERFAPASSRGLSGNELEVLLNVCGGLTAFFRLVTGPVWRFQERQADREVVDRANDEQLVAVARLFTLLSKSDPNVFQRVWDIFDEHPSDAERARMFLEAQKQRMAQIKEAV
ncbi:hypothetical protein E3J61_01635 [Candidatus Dependentiae bacterium]|nr:MAG: hypothetical protein E3J61_01635 [Candidatus Dependentiae bacterium]